MSILQACRKPRREKRYLDLLASHTSKEMSRVKKHQREKEKCDGHREKNKNTEERTSMKRNNNHASYIFGK